MRSRLLSALFIIAGGFPVHAQPAPSSPPLVLEAAYTAELWSNLRGGLRQDAAYLDNFDLSARLDAEKAIGLQGATILASVLHNNRSIFSESIVGDLQTVSNIDTDGSWRLYEMWVEQALGETSLKAGLIDLNSEFDVVETASAFLNSSFGIGHDFAQAGENGPSIFPITGLGIVGRANISEDLDFRAAAFEGTPGHEAHPRRMRLHLGDEGALLIGELGYNLSTSNRIAVGVWRFTEQAESLQGRQKGSSGGYYASIDTRLVDTPSYSLSAFARAGFADPDVYRVSSYQGAGLLLSGPLLTGQDEQLGIAVASARNGAPFRRVQALRGVPVEARETAIELTYKVQLTSFLSLQPDIQYIVNPAMNPSVKDALAVGLRTVWSWSNARD